MLCYDLITPLMYLQSIFFNQPLNLLSTSGSSLSTTTNVELAAKVCFSVAEGSLVTSK